MAANGGPHGTPHENGDGGGKHKRGSHKRGNSLSEGMSRLFFGLRGLHGGGGSSSGGAGGSSEERAPTPAQQQMTSSSSKAAKKVKRGRSQSSKDRTSSSPSSSPSSSSRDKIKKRSGGSSAPTWDRIEQQPASQPPSHHQVRAALTPSGSQREPAVWRSSSGGDLAERWSVRRGAEREAATSVTTTTTPTAAADHSREQPAASASSSSSSSAATAAAITAGLQLSLQPAANGSTTTSGTATPPALSPRERKEFIGRARTAATPPHPSATHHREPSQQTQKRRQQLQLQLQIQQQQEGLDEAGPRSWKATTPLHSPLSGPSEDEHPAWGGSGATSGSEADEKRFPGAKLGSEPESGSETEHMAAMGGMSSPTTASYTSSSTTTTSSSASSSSSSSSSSTASTGIERVRLTKRTVQDFEFGKVLGEGSYGQVRAARDIATGLLLAIKILDKRHVVKENKVEQVKREKQILESLSHPNIIHLYGTFQDNNSLFFAMEYCPNGELHQHLKRLGSFNLECTQFYIAELVSALEYLHSQGIVHRDIKPENMLLDANFHLKLIDFGTAKSVGPDQYARSTSFVGTAEYVPPELLNEHYSVKSSDLWALSCVLYQFLAGKSPFRGANDYKTFRKIKKLKIKFPTGFPAVAKDLVQRLLVPDWTQRLDFAHLKAHRFFEGIDWAALHTTTPPVLAAPAVPVFVDEEKERKLKAQQAKSSVWGKFLFKNSDEVIIQTDRVAKISKHFFGATKSPKKRQLILTDFPRLFYVDIDRMAQAGEIEWRSDLRVEARHDNIFEITSGEKTYIFEFEAEGRAVKWCAAISRLQRRNNGEEEEDEDDAGDDENDFAATEDEGNDRAHPHEPPVAIDHPMTARDDNRERDK